MTIACFQFHGNCLDNRDSSPVRKVTKLTAVLSSRPPKLTSSHDQNQSVSRPRQDQDVEGLRLNYDLDLANIDVA